MTHADLTQLFIQVFTERWPDWRVFPNRSGVAEYRGTRVPYGVPPTGGGADFLAFGPGGFCQWWELKTEHDRIRPKQKNLANVMTAMGFPWYIFRETAEAPYYTVTLWKQGGGEIGCNIL